MARYLPAGMTFLHHWHRPGGRPCTAILFPLMRLRSGAQSGENPGMRGDPTQDQLLPMPKTTHQEPAGGKREIEVRSFRGDESMADQTIRFPAGIRGRTDGHVQSTQDQLIFITAEEQHGIRGRTDGHVQRDLHHRRGAARVECRCEACQVEWCDAAAEPADSRHHPPGGLGESDKCRQAWTGVVEGMGAHAHPGWMGCWNWN